MGFQLHETMYGKNFFEHQLPALIRAINRLADVDEKRQAAEPAAVMKSNTVYLIDSIRVTDDLKLIINVKGGVSVTEELDQKED